MTDMEKHDEMLGQILCDSSSLSEFLNTIFGFLARRTNFYECYESLEKSDESRQKMVLMCMEKWNPKSLEVASPPAIEKEIEVETSLNECEVVNSETPNTPQDVLMKTEESRTPISSSSTSSEYFQPMEYYNGSIFENYCWSQTIKEIEVHVRLPKHIKSSKCLDVKIQPDSIRIAEKDTQNIILEGNLYSKCKSNDAIWSVSNRKLQISLDKLTTSWWKKFLRIEPEVKKLECVRELEDFPEETQVAFEKIRWDEHRKMLGLPTSKDMENTELLRRAWDAEGSPFKGQPFDQSLVKFQN